MMMDAVRVEITPSKGRHLIAQKAFKVGEVVISQEPYAAVLFNEHIQHFCNWCFKPGSHLSRCSKSKFARYCSRQHQLLDWKSGYKLESDFLVGCHPRVPPASIRLAAHVAWNRVQELDQAQGGEKWRNYAAVEALEDHWDDLSESRLKAFAEMGFFITKCSIG